MCGIIGIVSNQEVAQKLVLGLYDLQHRGEQAAGIDVFDGTELREHKGTGLVTEVFDSETSEEIFKRCSGQFGIGQTLYSTVGKKGEKNRQKQFSH